MSLDVTTAENPTSPIAELLIWNYARKEDWGEIMQCRPENLTKEIANKFLLCCLIDYRTKADDAWVRGERYFNCLSELDKRELWRLIAETGDWTSEEMFQRCALHWMRPAHNRLWGIASQICMYFDGDAREIWRSGTIFDVLCRLYYVGAGEQISRMIVGALKDSGHLTGKGDVKADGHICRVLGRISEAKEVSPMVAVGIARMLYPEDPWRLDGPLWKVGTDLCRPTSPKCAECDLRTQCKYAQNESLRG